MLTTVSSALVRVTALCPWPFCGYRAVATSQKCVRRKGVTAESGGTLLPSNPCAIYTSKYGVCVSMCAVCVLCVLVCVYVCVYFLCCLCERAQLSKYRNVNDIQHSNSSVDDLMHKER
jgi:hypothetical protein